MNYVVFKESPSPSKIRAAFLVLVCSVALTACASGTNTSKGDSASAQDSSGLPSSISGFPSSTQVTHQIQEGITLKTFPPDLSQQITKLTNGEVNGPVYAAAGTPNCIGATGPMVEPISECTGGDKSSNQVLALIGDSRTGMWGGTFHNVGYLEHFKVVSFYKSGCPAPIANYVPTGQPQGSTWTECNQYHNDLIKELNSIKPKVIVISSQTELDVTTPSPNHLASPMETKADLEMLIKALPKESKVVVLAGFPTPGSRGASNPTSCLGRNPSAPSDCNFGESATVSASNQAFQDAAAATGSGFIDQRPWFCLESCPAIINSTVVYTTDAYHSNGVYLTNLTGVLGAALAPYIGSASGK